jgi:hypothetical protein
MPWLDDAGMHRPDRNLMQALTMSRQKYVWRARGRRCHLGSEWLFYAPTAMIKPRSLVGKTDGFQPIEIMDRSLEANGGCMNGADRWESSVRGFYTGDADFEGLRIEQRHVDSSHFAPKTKQYQAAVCQVLACQIPDARGNDCTRPGALRFDWGTRGKNLTKQ